MRRRTVLKSVVGITSTAIFTGCLGQTYDNAPADAGESANDITDSSFDVIDRNCGNETNTASVSTANSTVDVTGTIAGSDMCKTAELETLEYDVSADELRVDVATTNLPDVDVCAQCITEIEYELSVEFSERAPEHTVIRHHDIQGTTVHRGQE